MKLSELIKRAEGRGVEVLEFQIGNDPEIRGVCEDSRKARPGDLFIARSGTKTTGAKFIEDSIARGAVAVVAEEKPSQPIPFARVKNANLAAAILAHEAAGNPTAAG